MTDDKLTRHLREQVPGRGKRQATAAAASKIPDQDPVDQPPLTKAKPPSHRERDDHYQSVIWQSHGWRVIVCHDDIQWIIQRRGNAGGRGVEWKGKSYCTTRDALIRDWRRHTGDAGASLATSLPDSFRRQR